SEAEPCAAVVEQVELDIAAAANELMAALLVAPGLGHPRPHDPRIGRAECLADPADEGEIALPSIGLGAGLGATIEIVEEDAAGAARLVAVRQEEILVAPFLVRGVGVRRVGVA